MKGPTFRDDCEVAVIGAGPYGLAVAAHLKSANVATRVFGPPISRWRNNMPRGMKLRSAWRATHIADPNRRFTLDVFAHRYGLDPVEECLPLKHFVSYGDWFQRQTVGDLDARSVIRVEETGRGFCVVLEDGEPVRAPCVVVAVGLASQEYRPRLFAGLPSELVSHTCEHADLAKWRGRRVAVIGRGQSACESAALLREAGSDVELICRGEISWIEPAHAPADPPWLARVRRAISPPSAAGATRLGGWLNELPGVVHRTPTGIRGKINAQSLRPAAAAWLRPRLTGVRVQSGREIVNLTIRGNQVGLELDSGVRVYDHVLLATGYRPDLAKLRMLPRELVQKVACVDGSPVLSAGFESTVPKLHFVGASAVASFGPLLSLLAGTGYAARSVTRAVLAGQGHHERKNLAEVDCDFLTSGADLTFATHLPRGEANVKSKLH